jgi:hypothetical protein
MRRKTQPKWLKNAKRFALGAIIALGPGFGVKGDYAKEFETQAYASEAPTPPAEKRGVIAQKSQLALSVATLEHEITSRITRVEEFKALRELCAELKIRCWLFGGTAAGYGHYVKWDLMREGGDQRYQPDRFDYDYTNIFRSTQDADLVIDGTAEQAKKIEDILKQRFKHFQGSKSVWEVRLLKEARGEKDSLLRNPNFLNQHTDSNSTGMIEVTEPPLGESAIRDLRDWTPLKGKSPIFLQDVHQGKLHYYFSPTHAATRRAAKGLNPPILSVIRYLTKVFQYELEIQADDLRQIQKIISDFNPARDAPPGYVRDWIEKNGKKLIQNAVNIEYAWNQLEALGLRRKLLQLGDPKAVDTLGWWMNKVPLRSRTVGQGSGKTARELGITIVAHEAKDFLSYESMIRAHTGDPNLLISRKDLPGETAAFGDGFYTAEGIEGARGTGFTVRFQVNPDARGGSDFILARSDQAGEPRFIIFRNKNAFSVIPESLNIGPIDYFRILSDGKTFQHSDRGIQEKLRRRIGNKLPNLTDEEIAQIRQLVWDGVVARPPRLGAVREVLSFNALKNDGFESKLKQKVLQACLDSLKEEGGKLFLAFDELLAAWRPNDWRPNDAWFIDGVVNVLDTGTDSEKIRALGVLARVDAHPVDSRIQRIILKSFEQSSDELFFHLLWSASKERKYLERPLIALLKKNNPSFTISFARGLQYEANLPSDWVVKLLKESQPTHPEFLEYLKKVIYSPKTGRTHKSNAVAALGVVRFDPEKVIPILLEFLNNPELAQLAIGAFSELKISDPRIEAALVRVIQKDTNRIIITEAINALSEAGPTSNPRVVDVILDVIRHDDSFVSQAGIYALKILPPSDPRVVDAFIYAMSQVASRRYARGMKERIVAYSKHMGLARQPKVIEISNEFMGLPKNSLAREMAVQILKNAELLGAQASYPKKRNCFEKLLHSVFSMD